jgi:superfamily II DNA helicase RecQ
VLSASTELLAALHEVFGFSEFRALQEDAVRAAVAGRDVLVVIPAAWLWHRRQ